MIATDASLELYFVERLQAAAKRLGLEIRSGADAYLSSLLAVRALTLETTLSQTLVERWQRAMSMQDRRKRAAEFQGAGDAALYTCGFFSSALEQRGVARGYVANMGSRSYQAASHLGKAPVVLSELSQRFDAYVDLLDEVREDTELRTPQSIVRLYDRWRKTRSPRLAERLRDVGLFPVSDRSESLN